MSDAKLRERFGRLWTRLGATDAEGLADRLVRAYAEPHRRYHGLDHLRDCLAQLDAAPADEKERELAEIALWFHDAVFIPSRADNERRSADWAADAMLQAGMSEVRAGEVTSSRPPTPRARWCATWTSRSSAGIPPSSRNTSGASGRNTEACRNDCTARADQRCSHVF
jgi:hypothetical protein